jgi:hypothetical protein
MDLTLRDKPDIDKAKNIVCALVHFSGGRFEGKTRLNKAFWRAHVYHYRHNAGLLSKYPIARLPEGPAIDDLDDLLVILEREGRISVEDRPRGKFVETVIHLESMPPCFSSSEERAIKEGLKWVKGKTAVQVRDESHFLSSAWQTNRNGEIIDLALEALDSSEVKSIAAEKKKISANLAWAKEVAMKAFGE